MIVFDNISNKHWYKPKFKKM